MRRPLFLLSVLALVACASAGGGDPGDGVALSALDPAQRFQTGHALFSARCQSCHALPEPTRLRPAAWPAEVLGMSRKSGLSPDQAALISDYLVAASSRPGG